MHKEDRLYKLSKGSDTAMWAHDEIVMQDSRIAELEAIVKAVAHIGVDFGYGKYELEAGIIDDARTLMEQE